MQKLFSLASRLQYQFWSGRVDPAACQEAHTPTVTISFQLLRRVAPQGEWSNSSRLSCQPQAKVFAAPPSLAEHNYVKPRHTVAHAHSLSHLGVTHIYLQCCYIKHTTKWVFQSYLPSGGSMIDEGKTSVHRLRAQALHHASHVT